jgi:DNA-binding PadR family transcriptional regulator
MEQSGWLSSEMGTHRDEQKARYYKLTAVGKKELQKVEKSFEQLVKRRACDVAFAPSSIP